jgi:uncharacterized protein YbjT (DUF2867 family)
MSILLTGGRGHLGQLLVGQLVSVNLLPRILTSGNSSGGLPLPHVQCDLSSESSVVASKLAGVLGDVECVVHLASSAQDHEKVDIKGTQNLVDVIRSANASPHLVYVSIVGVDQIPFSYYQSKFQAEKIIQNSGIPYSILRATQFHPFVEVMVQSLSFMGGRVALVSKQVSFQPVDTLEVALKLRDMILAGPSARVEDFGGPEILTMDALSRTWHESRGKSPSTVSLPVFGSTLQAFKDGRNLCPEAKCGEFSWQDYLVQNIANPYRKRLSN